MRPTEHQVEIDRRTSSWCILWSYYVPKIATLSWKGLQALKVWKKSLKMVKTNLEIVGRWPQLDPFFLTKTWISRAIFKVSTTQHQFETYRRSPSLWVLWSYEVLKIATLSWKGLHALKVWKKSFIITKKQNVLQGDLNPGLLYWRWVWNPLDHRTTYI